MIWNYRVEITFLSYVRVIVSPRHDWSLGIGGSHVDLAFQGSRI